MFLSPDQHTWLVTQTRAASLAAAGANDAPPDEKKIPPQLRLIGATALLIFTVVAMVVVIAYLMRAWRRQISEPLTPTRIEPDAWARKSLAPRDDAERGNDGRGHA